MLETNGEKGLETIPLRMERPISFLKEPFMQFQVLSNLTDLANSSRKNNFKQKININQFNNNKEYFGKY